MVYWYNNSPNAAGVVPSETIFVYTEDLGTADEDTAVQGGCNPYSVGDNVYVKPSKARCSTPWDVKVVTAILSPTAVEIGGVPRHVADVRRASRACDVFVENGHGPVDAAEGAVTTNAVTDQRGRCTRPRRAPAYLADYAVG